MPTIPQDPAWDCTLPLMADPYFYIGRRCRELNSPLFQTRFMLSRTICMTGSDAAALFYDPERFQRQGAAPFRLQATLFGRGGVQTLDGEAHRHRKQMFMTITAGERLPALVDLFEHHWLEAMRHTSEHQPVALYDQFQDALCRAATQWAGIPISEAEYPQWRRELVALFDGAGAMGPKHWWSRWSRQTAQARLATMIDDIRAGKQGVPESSAAFLVAHHRELNGEPLDARTAAVELLNVVRPIVAVSVYLTFTALALHDHPECREPLASSDEKYREWFAQEIRRFYPFFPAVNALVRETFTWKGFEFPAKTRVLLDLYGINHDPALWPQPDAFRPERYGEQAVTPFNFVPQGGSDAATNHRCPGEGIAMALIERTAELICRTVDYSVPQQDLSIDFSRLPAIPRSRFLIEDVKFAKAAPIPSEYVHI